MKNKLAKYLLSISAVELSPDKPFVWASGWKSPIYCDNRKTLSYPEIRTYIRDNFIQKIKLLYPQAEVIAGVATGAIAHAAIVAQKLGLPMIYVRPKAKGHGLQNRIEGVLHKGQKVVVIEDLISTGGSSAAAVEAIREEGGEVLGLLAIFTYGFDTAIKRFEEINCKVETLTDYDTLIQKAVDEKYISPESLPLLQQWRKDPENFGK